MKQSLIERFENLKSNHKNFVCLDNKEKILISCPHAVEQTRNGEIKYSEPETAFLALYLYDLGFPCFIKTSNENDDANRDLNCKYKDEMVKYCKENNIQLVIDLHQLRRDREMHICLGTGNEKNKNLCNKSHILQQFLDIFQKDDYIVTINNPFSASKNTTVSGYISSFNIPSIQMEINSGIVDKNFDFNKFANTLEILLNKLKIILNKKFVLLVTNASLNTEKFKIQNDLLFKTARTLNIELVIKNNTELMFSLFDNSNNFSYYDAVLFYDKDVNLCKKLENLKYKVFNSSQTIKNCDNKVLTYQVLEENNIPIPKTFVIPLIFYYKKDLLSYWVNNLLKELKFPFIAKKWYGSEGQQVYLIDNENTLWNLIEQEKGSELLFQHYYEECKGKDIRINIVNNKIVASMKRLSLNGDFRSNLSNGGHAEIYIPTKEESDLALKASKALNCDFCGVDILQTNDGPVICEVNSNAHLNNIYNVTNINVSEHILKYIKSKIEG